jgi:hypothetical protein
MLNQVDVKDIFSCGFALSLVFKDEQGEVYYSSIPKEY